MSSLAIINTSMAALRLSVNKWTPVVLQKALSHSGSSDVVIPRRVPSEYEDVEFPEKTRLRVTQRIPDIPIGIRHPKMAKKLGLMRGAELVHNTLLHKQYGIVALRGGRLKVKHFENIRTSCFKKLDKDKHFAIWRVEHPWQPLFKKGIGHKMGGGKGGINEYCTPVKRDQVIIEVGGHCDYFEVRKFLTDLANRMPFKAMAVNQEIMEKRAKDLELMEELNTNKWTLEYIFKNQMGSAPKWIRRQDFFFFGKYL